jgi:hypothetical protein
MALFEVDAGSGVISEQPRRQAAFRLGWCVEQPHGAEVLGADVPVLAGTDQPHRCAVVGRQRGAVEVVGNEDVVAENVLEAGDGPVAVAPFEPAMGKRPTMWVVDRDHRVEKISEQDAAPSKTGCRPTSHAVEVRVHRCAPHAQEVCHGYSSGDLAAVHHVDRGVWWWWR